MSRRKGGNALVLRRAGEKYLAISVAMTKIGGGSPVCCAKNMEKLRDRRDSTEGGGMNLWKCSSSGAININKRNS
jgi:hypothetical protein